MRITVLYYLLFAVVVTPLTRGRCQQQTAAPQASVQAQQSPAPPPVVLVPQPKAPEPGEQVCGTRSTASQPLTRVHFNELEQIARFNYMDRDNTVTDRGFQYRVRARVVVDLSGDCRTYLRMRSETGLGFDNSWDYTGASLASGEVHFNVKTFAVGHLFGPHLTGEVGGLEFEQGAGTEVTYASGDGYLMGYRLFYSGSRSSKLSITTGYVDVMDPRANVFSRFNLGKFDYVQLLGQRELAPHTDVSMEFDSLRGIEFVREAVNWKSLPHRVLDSARFEFVQRWTDYTSFAWSGTLTRNFGHNNRVKANLIYSDMPLSLYRSDGIAVLLNRGEIQAGKRLSGGAAFAITRNFEAGFFSGRLLDSTPTKRWVEQVYLRYDYTHAVNRIFAAH